MNEQRTSLRGGLRIGGSGALTSAGLSRHFLRPAITALVRLGLLGLVALLGPADTCVAAEAGATTTGAAAGTTSPGIRNPYDAHAYMRELAGRLSTSSDKQVLLRGLPEDKTLSQNVSVPAPKAGDSAMPTSRPVVTAQVFAGGENGLIAKDGDKSDTTPKRYMAFWGDPSLNGMPVENVGPAGTTSSITQTTSAQTVPGDTREAILGPLGVAMDSMTPGVRLASEQTPANLAAQVTPDETVPVQDIVAADAPVTKAQKARWSAGTDLDKYRAHAVKEGSRNSGDNIKKAFERAGLTLQDGVNVFVLGYASPRGEAFRANDGKGLLDDPGKVPQQAGETIGNAGLGLYSVADLVLLNSLPDPNTTGYGDNHPVVRPLLFTGRMIGGVWKTTEEAGNALTWGYFDNVTGCIGMCIEDILELLKHTGEAVTNIARVPVQLIAGKNEKTEQAMDWVLLVPLEFVSNSAEMKGVANMQDYKMAFEDKGVIGSVIELGGSSFLVYRGAKELADKLDHKHHHKSRAAADSSDDNGGTDTPTDPEIPTSTGPDQVFLLDGDWPMENGTGAVQIDGVWTSFKTWRE